MISLEKNPGGIGGGAPGAAPGTNSSCAAELFPVTSPDILGNMGRCVELTHATWASFPGYPLPRIISERIGRKKTSQKKLISTERDLLQNSQNLAAEKS